MLHKRGLSANLKFGSLRVSALVWAGMALRKKGKPAENKAFPLVRRALFVINAAVWKRVANFTIALKIDGVTLNIVWMRQDVVAGEALKEKVLRMSIRKCMIPV